ncbi:MAG: hypothetical protein ACXW3R_14850, partial [Rhodoplanes sp.]
MALNRCRPARALLSRLAPEWDAGTRTKLRAEAPSRRLSVAGRDQHGAPLERAGMRCREYL